MTINYREVYLDITKGIGILVVIIGHLQLDNVIRNFIYCFVCHFSSIYGALYMYKLTIPWDKIKYFIPLFQGLKLIVSIIILVIGIYMYNKLKLRKKMSKCLICENDNWFKYCDIEGQKYDVLICKKCSFTKLDPTPTEEELNQFYSKTYRAKYSNQDEVDQEVIDYEQLRADRVLSVIKPYFKKSFVNILDVGCSSGTLLKNVATLSEKPILHGIEMNDNYRNFIVKTNIAKEENVSNSDINTFYKNQEEKFDFISIVHVLEHLKDPVQALKSIHALLNGEGMMYIEVPNLKTPYNNLRKQYFAVYHLYNFTETTLRALLQKVGFEILEENQIANTSICFVCKKSSSKVEESKIDNKEFNTVVEILKKYERFYPLIVVKQYIIKILITLGIKDYVKKLIGK